MLSFLQFINTYTLSLLESLTPVEQEEVNSRNLNTSVGEELMGHVIPKGQHHTEIPLMNPLHLKIAEHLRSKPIRNQNGEHIGHWQIVDNENAKHPTENKTRPISSLIKDNPELLSEYNKSRSLKGKSSGEVNVDNLRVNDPDKKETRWTAPTIDSDQYKIIISRHPHAVLGKSSTLKPWRSCAKLGNCDHAAKNLDSDVEEGGAVAYLVHKDEPNPNNPERAIGRISLNPFISDNGHRVLRAAPKHYGADDAYGSFQRSVKHWAETNFPLKDEEYTLHPKVYQGDTGADDYRIYKPLSDEEKQKKVDNLHKLIDYNYVSEGDIDAAERKGYLNSDHIDKIINNEKLSDLHKKIINLRRPLTKSQIKTIVNNPRSNGGHYALASLHYDTPNILDKDDIKTIIKNEGNANAISSLINSHEKHGNILDSDDISTILGHKKFTGLHWRLAELNDRIDGLLQPHHIKQIAANILSTDAHQALAKQHLRHKNIFDKEDIDNIINNKDSFEAHQQLASSDDLEPWHIQKIFDNKDNVSAHVRLLTKHLIGKITLPKENLQALINNPIFQDIHPELHKRLLKMGDDIYR